MSPPYIEIIVEFGIILLAPLVFQYYLWRSKDDRQSRMFKQNIVLFGLLYAAVFILALIHSLKPLKLH